MTGKTKYARVAVPIHTDKSFTYLVPENLKAKIAVGCEVLVDLGRRRVTGFVVDFDTKSVQGIKEIRELICEKPLFTNEMLKLTRWIADYYMCSWGEALKAAIPAGAEAKERTYVTALKPPLSTFAGKELDILEVLAGREKTSMHRLRQQFPDLDIATILRRLEAKNAVALSSSVSESSLIPRKEILVTLANKEDAAERITDLRKRSPKQSAILEYLAAHEGSAKWAELRQALSVSVSSLGALEKKNLVRKSSVLKSADPTIGLAMEEPPPPKLEHHQAHALTLINDHLDRHRYRTMLLYGVTGSGKTEVYLRAASLTVASRRQAIVLVPEISLTPQTASRFIARFGHRVAILHSRLSARERADVWRRIGERDFDVVIGPRSAVFAPFPNLGLIVVDEEHEASYKQSDLSPRYNARDVAVMRARIENCLCLLGSATPSLESFQNAKKGKYDLAVLPERIDKRPMPRASIVDMRGEEDPIFSSALKEGIADRVKRGEQVMLLLNRRGFSRFVLCKDCGHVVKCPNCSVSLTYHQAKGILLCHYCDHRKKAPDACPRCKSTKLLLKGLGTERVEREVKKILPGIRILRMDLDTTRKKHAHRDIYQTFRRHEADVLLGTQMIAKGFDFPEVTLVGVISADTCLNAPDLRSSERTFQLLTQVAGRAGRSVLGGEVIIQTFSPDLDVIQAAASQGYRQFFDVESSERGELDYPPFSRMAKIGIRSRDRLLAETTATKLKRVIERNVRKNGSDISILGPAPAPVFRLRGNYRYQILLKASGPMVAQKILSPILARWSAPRKVKVTVDIDPIEIF